MNGRLTLEHGSDRPQTLGKRVSDDLQLSIFRRGKKNSTKLFGSEIRFSSFSVDFGGATPLLTSKSDSLTNFASGTQIFRSVRRLEVSFGRLLRSDTHHGTIARALNRNGYNWRQVAKKSPLTNKQLSNSRSYDVVPMFDHGRPWSTMVDHGRPWVDHGRPWVRLSTKY